MSDILTNLYINIDNLNYLENPRGIDYNDINLLNTKRRQTLIVPSLCLLSTLLISRFRPKLWSYTKNYFIGNRGRQILPETENITQVKTNVKEALSVKSDKPVVTNKSNQPVFEEVYYESVPIKIQGSRNLKLKKSEVSSDKTVNLPRKEPSIATEYLSFTKNYNPSENSPENKLKIAKNLSILSKMFGNSDSFKNKAEDRMLNTKFIYIPFMIVLFSYLYDLAYTYFGLYFKYQPLINEYYDQKRLMSKE